MKLTDSQLTLYLNSKRKLLWFQEFQVEWWDIINSKKFNKYIESLDKGMSPDFAYELAKKFGK